MQHLEELQPWLQQRFYLVEFETEKVVEKRGLLSNTALA
jgi:hypothetical protein